MRCLVCSADTRIIANARNATAWDRAPRRPATFAEGMEKIVVDDSWSNGINPNVANPARIYDYLLGGKDNFPADREVAEQVIAVAPTARDVTRQNRAFLRRAVRFLAGEAGVRQFLDIGSGLPTQGNVHEIAQAIAPDTCVVYVDNDPIVVTHGRALLAGDNTAVIKADLREPDAIVGHPKVREVIDFDRPIAVLLVSVLHFVKDEHDPEGIVARFRDAVPIVNRTGAEVRRLFDGWDLVDPGLVSIQLWKPDDASSALPGGFYGGVGRKG